MKYTIRRSIFIQSIINSILDAGPETTLSNGNTYSVDPGHMKICKDKGGCTYEEAANLCKDDGGTLPIYSNSVENKLAASLFRRVSLSVKDYGSKTVGTEKLQSTEFHFWIGLTDKVIFVILLYSN